MTAEQFDAACRAFTRRRPFRPFLIEYTSGAQVVVNHPEAVRAEARFHVARSPDGNYVLLAPEGKRFRTRQIKGAVYNCR
jgi:hypothetical protein